MTDEQPKGMEPDEGIRPGRTAEDDEPNAEGHAAKFRPFTDETQPGEQGSEPLDDQDASGHAATIEQRSGIDPDGGMRSGRIAEDDEPNAEGHAIRGKGGVTEDTQPGEQGNEPSDDDDAEGHRASLYSDRNLKRDITPVVW